MTTLLYDTMQKFVAWDIKDESYITEMVALMQPLIRFHTLKRMAYMETKYETPLSLVRVGEAFHEARELVRACLADSVPALAKEKMEILIEATRRLALERAKKSDQVVDQKAVAGRSDSLEDVEFVQADSDEEGESSEYFNQLMKQGAQEYGDSDEDDEEGHRAAITAGHRNPDNVNASEESILLPQLFSRENWRSRST